MSEKHLKYYSKTEEQVNVISHGIGLLLSVIALVLFIRRALQANSAITQASYVVFAVSLVLLYTASTFYHYVQEPVLRKKLNILDHAAIYVLIAGTYTPFTLITLNGSTGWAIFGSIWAIAIIGVVLKLFYTGRFNKISTIAYVAMGWIIIFAINPLIQNLSTNGLFWLFTGGIFYTIGALLYSIKKLKYNHAIFHVFVLLGSFSHFVSVYYYV